MERQVPGHAGTVAAAQLALAGLRVLLTRRPDRSARLARVLEEAGADVRFLPLIDFEQPSDSGDLLRALRELSDGRFSWLVITSTTTVDALAGAALDAGTTLAAALPAHTRVAAVGSGTAGALKRAGVDADLVPALQSAAGMLAEWPEAGSDGLGAVLLPQADSAASTLRVGLQTLGLDVRCVTAYRTVPYPADRTRALYGPVSPGGGLLAPEAAGAQLAAGRIAAVLAASPSQVRRLVELELPLDRCALVAIGPSTDHEARRLGLAVAAVAEDPGAQGVAAAVGRVRNQNPQNFDTSKPRMKDKA